MWSDNETERDLLGFDALSASIVELVRRDELLPLTIGVFGDWGSGKSSLMRMARRGLEDANVVTVMFSPWQHEDYSDVRSALMAAVVDAIEQKKSLFNKLEESGKRQVASLVGALRSRINVFQLFGLAASAAPIVTAALAGDSTALEASRIIPQAAPALLRAVEQAGETTEKKREKSESADTRVSAFRKDLDELLRVTGVERVVIFVDDLDRCLPENIIGLLEIIKLFLAVPRAAFVIGADERLVRHAVVRRYPEMPGVVDALSRDYLEKMIQIPIRVPPMTPAETETYLNLLGCDAYLPESDSTKARALAATRRSGVGLGQPLGADALAHEVGALPAPLAEHLRVVSLITPVLGVKLKGNPRLTKRFVNTLNHRIDLAHGRGLQLRPGILAKLMLLEYFHEDEFRTLFSVLAESSGMPPGIGHLEKLARENAAAPLADSKGVPLQLQSWLSMPELAAWLAMEPSLDGENLVPYFYYSRDRVSLGPLSGVGLSSDLQEILRQLISTIEMERDLGYKRAASLSGDPLKALFAEICVRIGREPDAVSGDLLIRAIKLAHANDDLVVDLARALQVAPVKQILPATPVTIVATWTRKPPAVLVDLIRSWSSQSDSRPLATRAGQALKQLL